MFSLVYKALNIFRSQYKQLLKIKYNFISINHIIFDKIIKLIFNKYTRMYIRAFLLWEKSGDIFLQFFEVFVYFATRMYIGDFYYDKNKGRFFIVFWGFHLIWNSYVHMNIFTMKKSRRIFYSFLRFSFIFPLIRTCKHF